MDMINPKIFAVPVIDGITQEVDDLLADEDKAPGIELNFPGYRVSGFDQATIPRIAVLIINDAFYWAHPAKCRLKTMSCHMVIAQADLNYV